MIRLEPKIKSKGLKKTPMKRKPIVKKPPKVFKTRNPKTEKVVKVKVEISKIPKQKSRGLRIRIDPLDAIFSLYIRTRDNFTCQRCGVKSKFVQCAHFHSRRKQAVRFDPDNACSLCMGDHLYLDGNPLEKVEFFQNRLGQVKFDLLNSRTRITYPRPDKKMLTLYYQAKIKELDKVNL